jgi:hypothetical protein
MTFEDDFPSLKGCVSRELDCSNKDHYDMWDALPLVQVEKHCLDKVRVREAWIKFVNSVGLCDEKTVKAKIQFQKDLGMEEK